ncbi:hypothetical protein [Pyrobaculum aerophilum]|uniref:hypothetical protein n=1 Tax=Pyrobaculum aerophilum TaxID=13773 RepID=UPI002161417C|nr:hypothetical protein [Pyrobaculum aerophilum]
MPTENPLKYFARELKFALRLIPTNGLKNGVWKVPLPLDAQLPIGAVKRYLLNKVPRELGATKVATGHHAHDFLAYYFKNLAGRHFEWNFKILPRLDGQGLILTRIRPLIFARPEENEELC